MSSSCRGRSRRMRQLFYRQMVEQGKRAKIFGSDGLDSGDFTAPGPLHLVVRSRHPRPQGNCQG